MAAFAGFGLMLVFSPALYIMSRVMKSVSYDVMERRDIRGRLTSEAVSAMRTVKVSH